MSDPDINLRDLASRFLTLPTNQRRGILASLGVVEKDDFLGLAMVRKKNLISEFHALVEIVRPTRMITKAQSDLEAARSKAVADEQFLSTAASDLAEYYHGLSPSDVYAVNAMRMVIDQLNIAIGQASFLAIEARQALDAYKKSQL